MAHIRRNAPGDKARRASETIGMDTDNSEDTTTLPVFKLPEDRFGEPVPLRIAAAPVIARLAQRYRISTLHAAVVTDLLEIGGRT